MTISRTIAARTLHLLPIAVAAAAMVVAAPSQALTWAFNYVSTNAAAPYSAIGRVTTSNVADVNGDYAITGVSGNVDGDTIFGLIDNPNTPDPATTPSGNFQFNNILHTSGRTFDLYGLMFSSASGFEYNLFSTSNTSYRLSKGVLGQRGNLSGSIGTLTSGAVPEPASWALMIIGFGMVGTAARRREGQRARA